ncbi:acylphosphatase [Halorubrum aquaticum]
MYVSGRVQGVFYRATTRDTARERGVDGWVRNLDDGRVEAVFEGPESAVEAMVEWCHTGSPAAEVDDVDATYGEPEGIDGFEVRR